ncbi:MAG: 1-acyl-sn-glycerol-3-phosphate acyltransferase [Lachnospiraceae bacterium]|jgi:1-acyl-sn-glycerol-3-phosphate acyltransferase|nr:1-acyl-sn-glycerol-3-phosphate acyltransferase [Lachnospiraceae bacterium]MCI9133260.1 1-acyl-sn-glycerol-3-phosphate acyltransferase [Lachnospiraceae bacterium]
MIRFILVVIIVLSFLILGIPVLLVEWIVGKFNRHAKDYSCLRIVQGAFKLILWTTGVKTTVIGQEHVPKDQAVLYIGNHRSYFDILLTYSRCPRLTGYVAKVEMLRYWLLRDWMKALYCLFLDREDMKAGLKTILQGIEYIKNGISICIFPEGTRNRTDQMMPFKEGSLKMAEKTGCPIIPMAITNSAEIFENHLPFIRPCRVILEYGEPIYPKELSKEERKFLGAYTQQKIQEMLDKNAALI